MLIFILFIFSNLPEDYTVDPYLIFAESDSVISNINTVKYHFAFSGTGALSNIIPEFQGETSLGYQSGAHHPLMYHSILTMSKIGTVGNLETPSHFLATADSIYYIEESSSTVFCSTLENSINDLFNFPPASVMMEYVISNPFNHEMIADSIAVLLPVFLNDVLCHAFHVFYSGEEQAEAVWFIGIDDLLPRAVERIGYYGAESMPGGQLLEISNIEPNCTEFSTKNIPEHYVYSQWNSLLEPMSQAPEFFLANKEGRAIRSSDFENKALLICFFSSWEPSSLATLGLLNSVASDYPEFVQSVGISINESSDPWFRLNSLGINFPILIFGENTARDYQVNSVPSIFLISEEGTILYSVMNPSRDESAEIVRLIESIR